MIINGWGRYPTADARILLPHTKMQCANLLKDLEVMIPRGMGRSYGDSANGSIVMQSTHLDRFISFDENTGILSCDAGTQIRQILAVTVPRGWFLSVTPGTSYVTIGGALASDVHGKNHHAKGAFSNSVLSFDLLLGSGEVLNVTKESHPDLFKATCGGMGLTGFILSVAIQLAPISSSQIIQSSLKIKCLEGLIEKFEENSHSPYSVAWLDCLASGKRLGRSILMLGKHAQDNVLSYENQSTINIPINAPSALLNQFTMRAFNAFYYHKMLSTLKCKKMSLGSYFYPLDAISNWNRLYGSAGFIQYQFVLPKSVGIGGLKKIIKAIVASEKGSFLAVLKLFGPGNDNYLSFPIEGYTLALDFKLSLSIFSLVRLLDEMVIDLGGRIYLTKDALLSESSFKRSYPQWETFEEVRAKYGAIGKFASYQSNRLGLQ